MAGEFYISGISNTGFDYMAYLEKYKELKNIPVNMMQTQLEDIKLKQEAIGAIKSKLTALFTPALDLTLSSTYETKKATLTNKDIASITVTNEALNGNFSLIVNQLAESSKWRIDTNSTITDINSKFLTSGTLTINYLKDGTTQSLTVDYTNKSLKEIADEINQSTDLEATIVNVGDTTNPDYRLIVKSVNTGTQNAITGISDSNGTSGVFNSSTSAEIVSAQDASITLDGITITSQSNTFSGVLTGVDITIKSLGTTEVSISDDYSPIKDKINAILDGYNQLKEVIRLATSRGQPLQGEATLNTIATNVLNTITSYLGKYGLIDTLGDAENTKGLLQLNEDTFNEFMKRDDARQILEGLGRALEGIVNNYVDNITFTEQRYKESEIRLQDRIEYMTKRINEQIEAMRLRFARLETYLSEMQSVQVRIQNFANLIAGNNNEK